MAYHQGACTIEKIPSNVTMKVLQPFSLKKIVHVNICLRNRDMWIFPVVKVIFLKNKF